MRVLKLGLARELQEVESMKCCQLIKSYKWTKKFNTKIIYIFFMLKLLKLKHYISACDHDVRKLWTCKCVNKLLRYHLKIPGGTPSKYFKTKGFGTPALFNPQYICWNHAISTACEWCNMTKQEHLHSRLYFHLVLSSISSAILSAQYCSKYILEL